MNLENVFDELIVAKKDIKYCPATGLDTNRGIQELPGTERRYASNSIRSSFNDQFKRQLHEYMFMLDDVDLYIVGTHVNPTTVQVVLCKEV
jgi:hypothetical protein